MEEEFLLVGKDGRLARYGPEVVAASTDLAGDTQAELTRPQVEAATPVCASGTELFEHLTRLRAELATEAESRGFRLLPSGTPLLPEDTAPGVTPKARYRRIAERFAIMADVGTSCGCHVHVGIPDRATGIEISNRLRPWLPALLALTANSPFVDGVDSGYSSCRYVRWSLWPSAGPPPLFESPEHYEDSVVAMLRVGAMVDRGMLYWDIRLSDNQPTLEIRVADVTPTPGQAAVLGVAVAALTARVLDDAERRRPVPPLRPEVLRALMWRAAHDGLTGRCPDPHTGELIPGQALPALLADHVRPVLKDEDLTFVLAGLERLGRRRGGAERQRAVYARNQRLTEVVDALVWHPERASTSTSSSRPVGRQRPSGGRWKP